MLKVLLAVLRAVVACTVGAATWLTLHVGRRAFVDDPTFEHPDDSFMFVIIGLVFGSVLLASLSRPLVSRLHRTPANVADVPGIAGKIAREDGTEVEGWPQALVGGMIGAVVAGFTAFPAVTPIAVGTAVVTGAAGFFLARMELTDRRGADEWRARIERMRGHGTRVVAEVIETDFASTWHYGGPVITVTARFRTPEGIRTFTDDIVTEPEDAPTPGGTVLIWYVGDGARRQDFYMEQDPDSIREPGAAERYMAPDAGS